MWEAACTGQLFFILWKSHRGSPAVETVAHPYGWRSKDNTYYEKPTMKALMVLALGTLIGFADSNYRMPYSESTSGASIRGHSLACNPSKH
jgi:3-methyladenine DNA glycosylase/8-oxoguanine DNA glycosylase